MKHNGSITAEGLPAGITYTVTEAEANVDGYTTSSTGATGTIPAGGTATAAFTNYKPTPHEPEETPGPGNTPEPSETPASSETPEPTAPDSGKSTDQSTGWSVLFLWARGLSRRSPRTS